MKLSIEEISVDMGVRRLIGQYGEHLDSRNLDQALALFTPDASLVFNGEEHKGHVAIRAWFEALARRPPGIHLLSNTRVSTETGQPGRARARSDVGFIRKLEDGWKILMAGGYDDVCEFRNDAWLFVRREITMS